MTWYPLAFIPPQLENSQGIPYSGAVLKAYAAGTNTNIPMATDYTGVTTAATVALNAAGYPTQGGSVIIPHVQQNYKLALYPTQAAADANSGAVWTVDNVQIADDTNTPFVQYFSGDGTTTSFTLSENLGTDEKILMVFADRTLAEHVSNGNFASSTGWTAGAGWVIGAGVATATLASSNLDYTSNLRILQGELYNITYTITRSVGTVQAYIGGGTDGVTRNASGTYTSTIMCGSNQIISIVGTGFTGTVDDISVKRVASSRRQILRPLDEYTVNGTTLTLTEAPPLDTNNIIVFAPSLLLGAAASAAAAAATSETNASNSATAAAASAAAAAASATAAAKRVIVTESGSQTFALTDADTYQRYTGGGGHVWTIPAAASVNFADGDEIDGFNATANDLTLTAAASVTVNGVTAGSVTVPPYSGFSLKNITGDAWDYSGYAADSWA